MFITISFLFQLCLLGLSVNSHVQLQELLLQPLNSKIRTSTSTWGGQVRVTFTKSEDTLHKLLCFYWGRKRFTKLLKIIILKNGKVA